MENSEKKHQRRVRYKGTHPRSFKEKYKEHQPEKYKDDIQKIIKKGNTPAGMHISIMVNEIIDFLDIKPGQIGLDATLGYGGHSCAMLEKLENQGHLFGLDIDPIEIKKTTQRIRDKGFDENIFTSIHTNFEHLKHITNQHGPFDFILADLGVSSMQIDNPERGFSFKVDSDLDLRLNPNHGISAATCLAQIDYQSLKNLLIENSDEPYAHEIAQAIMRLNKMNLEIKTTTDLKNLVISIIEKDTKISKKEQPLLIKKTCQRVFQALRIEVNREFDVLYDFLDFLPNALKPNGRVAILTFHSGEDRLVKKAFKEYKNLGLFSDISTEVIRPSAKECFENPRASSTKMRYAIKSEEII